MREEERIKKLRESVNKSKTAGWDVASIQAAYNAGKLTTAEALDAIELRMREDDEERSGTNA